MSDLEAGSQERAGSLRGLRVSDAMHRGVLTCPLHAPLDAVARMMARHRIHCVVVHGSPAESEFEGRLWGIVSDRDVLDAIAVEDVEDRTAGGSARGAVKTVAPNKDLFEAARIMASTGTSHLVVIDPETDRPVGVLSSLDLAAALAGESRAVTPAVRVEQLMTTDVVTVSPDTLLKEVAALLIERRISGVPVIHDREVVGVVSEGDILTKERGVVPHPGGLLGWLLGGDGEARMKLTARTAGEAMTSPAVTIPHWHTAVSAAGLMIDRGIKRLPVLREDELVGIVTRTDLVRAFARSDAAIERDIREEVLRRSFWMTPDAVQVEVRNGEVTLAGEVEYESVLDTLPGAVTAVPGVISVRSELRLRGSREADL